MVGEGGTRGLIMRVSLPSLGESLNTTTDDRTFPNLGLKMAEESTGV